MNTLVQELDPGLSAEKAGRSRRPWDNFLSERYNLTAVIVLIFVSTIPYLNALSNDFVYDDNLQIVNNRALSNPSSIVEFFRIPRGLKYVTLVADYQIWGLNPFGYHLTNLILHVLCTISLFLLLNILFANWRVSLMAALIFAVHPIHTEAVTAIANRSDLLAMFFFSWSFFLYIMKRSSLWYYLLSIISFLLALLAKEVVAVMLPVMLIFYDLFFSERNERRFMNKSLWYTLPYWLILILGLSYVLLGIKSVQPNMFFSQTLPIFYTACKAFLIDVKLLFLMHTMSADHVVPLSYSLFEGNVLLSIIAMILFFVYMIMSYPGSKIISFGMVFFFVTFLPVSNLLVQVIPSLTPSFVAERYLYLPSAGFCLIIAAFVDKIMNAEKPVLRQSPKKVGVFLLILIISLFSVLTMNRNLDWRSEHSLWAKTVKQSPDSFKAHNNLGVVYANEGRLDKAEEEFRTALQIRPDFLDARNNLGKVYLKQGLKERAKKEFDEVRRFNPDYYKARKKLGEVGSDGSVIQDRLYSH